MNAPALFAAAVDLPLASAEAIASGRGLVVVAPHPDDESLGCGGSVAEACAIRLPVALVVVSDGAGSHSNSKPYPAAKLRALRQQETFAAADVLGLPADRVHFLGRPDRGVPTHELAADAARSAIIDVGHAIHAGAVCAPWVHDPDCDHVATASSSTRRGRRCRT